MKTKTEAALLRELKAMKLPPAWLQAIKGIGARKFLRLFKKLDDAANDGVRTCHG